MTDPLPVPADSLPEPTAPVPRQIGPYLIDREIGSGGMGTVYLGQHESTGKVAAVKVLPPALSREEGFLARFSREIEAMRRVAGPNIVELYESGEVDGVPWYAMEYVAGETMIDRLHREKRIPWEECIEIGVQVCNALKSAHNAGVIHRDLKPSNLLLGENGDVKLTDFGIAQVFASGKLTITGGILGTAEYMSPEQAQGKRATKQSDIYSMGALLYAMLTGRPPFTGKTTLEIAQKHKFAQFDRPRRFVPEIPRWLDEVVCKCLAKKPEDRYPDAHVLALRLQEIPRKLSLAKGEAVYEYDASGSSAETMASDATPGRADDNLGGGTLMRDLVKAQMEFERRPRDLISKAFDNTWTLVGLLAVVVGTGFGLAYMSQPSDESLFAKGQELMGHPEGADWETARRVYFGPLIERDAEKWGPRAEPYLNRIELFELRRDLLGKAKNAISSTPPEPERILRRAHELHQTGETVAATHLLQALRHLLEGDQEHEISYQMAGQLLSQWEQEESQLRFRYVADALRRAERLFDEGKFNSAAAVWRSIITLYDDNLDTVEYVQQAREGLEQVPKTPQPTSDE